MPTEIGLLNILLVLTAAWLGGLAFARIKYPPMLGEILVGLILGPSLLGIINSSEALEILAMLGMFFLMLYAGMQTDPKELRKATKTSALVAIGGVIVPFVLGYYITLAFGYTVNQALFIGMCLSITSVATKARVLLDLGVLKTKIGHILLGAAVIDDIIALILLTAILGLVTTETLEIGGFLVLLAKVGLFFVATLLIGYKLFPVFGKKLKWREPTGFSFVLISAFVFGYLADLAGLHFIIGAFVAGLFVHEELMGKNFFVINQRISGITLGFLAPIFFVSIAFHVDFSIFTGLPLYLLAIVGAAFAGKIIGCGVASRIAGETNEDSLIVGLGMNGRGAVELVVAAIGLGIGILTPALFSVVVMMAFITTMAVPLAMKLAYDKFKG